MTDLGLNEHHEGIVKSYIQFARYQRGQNLKAVDLCFQDVLDSRLLEPTYTRSEVEDILRSLLDVVRGDIESELIGFAHNNVLLLSQLFNQAEKWHLRMNVNLSEIQNRELLECVKQMEVVDLGGHQERKRLEPVDNTEGAVALMRIEVGRLQQENERLDQIVKQAEARISELCNEKNNMLKDMLEKDKSLDQLKERIDDLLKRIEANENRPPINESVDSERILGEYEAVLSEQLSTELDSMRQQVLCVQSQLQLAEQELERKFNQTTAYSNMKKMIAKKNDLVKTMRRRLLEYEPNLDLGNEEEQND
ncbi:leucine zipper transcription factor-like protein 1 isoform X2 [Nilaparvata lugens]|uniref:leucine zipper transcription factor-like protein 1 isoform X1 n=1 Tax=Nilaparvata lugens TaxID=108931 RepID=UPI000B991DA1|nr:leucine zipper transcription factor-like protein 1 isoform X1 [Nilaparvata lugens]XP_039290332.1 leucine zipper transcription factor-like protein 1 isoform X2 [Nilaparvata lugens]